MEQKQMEMGQKFGIEALIGGSPSMGSSLKIDSVTSDTIDLKNNDLKSPFKGADQVK